VAEDELGAAKDGSVKVLIVKKRRLSCPSPSASSEPTPNTRVTPSLPLDGTRRTHVKGAVQDVAEDELGAAKDGGVKVLIVKIFILPIAICQRRNPRHACL